MINFILLVTTLLVFGLWFLPSWWMNNHKDDVIALTFVGVAFAITMTWLVILSRLTQ